MSLMTIGLKKKEFCYEFEFISATRDRVLSPLLQIGSFELDTAVYDDFERRAENITILLSKSGCCQKVITVIRH